jgi:hypothetical protein
MLIMRESHRAASIIGALISTGRTVQGPQRGTSQTRMANKSPHPVGVG